MAKITSNLIDGLPFEYEEPAETLIDIEKDWVEKHPRLAAKRLLTLKARIDGLERAVRAHLTPQEHMDRIRKQPRGYWHK